ncbi:MAG: phospholipase C [Solirubrobacteraceae bacterium]
MHEVHGSGPTITRRDALRNAGLAGIGLTAAGAGIDALLARAAEAASGHGKLGDIKHVVILIQENRSFDHYFGTLSGVRGFGDKRNRSAFFQKANGKTIHPFHLKTDCLHDLTHNWGPQHKSWNHGHMNHFLAAHEANDPSGVPPETMGYYKRSDLPFYYALADAYTICDGYHCSVIGPTDPNRLISLSGTLDPAGTHGGPLLETLVSTRAQLAGKFTWPTMPERLSAHGVSWKQYTAGGAGIFDNVLPYFKAYQNQSKEPYQRGVKPVYPDDFLTDLEKNRLPQVSWLLSSVADSEHPDFSGPQNGASVARDVFEAIVAHPKIWQHTALFITWDENGGFFDHVPPPTPPKGTKGEFLTVSKLPAAAEGIRGPIGLGFRVPMLVVSPFSRGGLVCSDTFDHTSTLRFLETRFGVKVPNLSRWRRKHTGDLTSAFNFAARPRFGKPRLPKAPDTKCSSFGTPGNTGGPFPRQESGKRRRPSGVV